MRKQKIFIDGLALVDGHFSGVGQYILGILRGIDQHLGELIHEGSSAPDVRIIIPYDCVGKFDSFGFRHINATRFPLSFRLMSKLWHENKLPPIDLYCGNGTYIFTRFADMRLANKNNKSILIIYDVSYELYRQYSDEGNAVFLSAAVKRSLNRASHVVTISDSAKKEIVDFYKIEPRYVTVATPATDPALLFRRSEEEIRSVKHKYGISGNYIITLSNLEPRKNLDSLVKAYCSLPEYIIKDTSLLLVGVSGWKTDKLFQEIIQKVQAGFKIIRPKSYVLDDDKAALLSGASMLVYPSHYEGFGMPPLEALACGTPVIVANNSSLPEAVGDNGAYVDSNDIEDIKKKIEDYFDNLSKISSKARKEGPRWALGFSWKESAHKILSAVEEIGDA